MRRRRRRRQPRPRQFEAGMGSYLNRRCSSAGELSAGARRSGPVACSCSDARQQPSWSLWSPPILYAVAGVHDACSAQVAALQALWCLVFHGCA